MSKYFCSPRVRAGRGHLGDACAPWTPPARRALVLFYNADGRALLRPKSRVHEAGGRVVRLSALPAPEGRGSSMWGNSSIS